MLLLPVAPEICLIIYSIAKLLKYKDTSYSHPPLISPSHSFTSLLLPTSPHLPTRTRHLFSPFPDLTLDDSFFTFLFISPRSPVFKMSNLYYYTHFREYAQPRCDYTLSLTKTFTGLAISNIFDE